MDLLPTAITAAPGVRDQMRRRAIRGGEGGGQPAPASVYARGRATESRLDNGAAFAMARGMTEMITAPHDCITMAEQAHGFGYMRAAARLKPGRDTVRDEARKAQVIGNVRRHAEAMGLPPERLAVVWDALVEQSIAYEFDEWDSTRV
jgi:Chorismate mutase type II